METLTLFIDNLYAENLGGCEYLTIEKTTLNALEFNNLIISGHLIKEVVFENIDFINCTFFSSHLENCLFINCSFKNCKFQFSKFVSCNFESTSFHYCIWGFTKAQDAEVQIYEATDNFSLESSGFEELTKTLNQSDFLAISA